MRRRAGAPRRSSRRRCRRARAGRRRAAPGRCRRAPRRPGRRAGTRSRCVGPPSTNTRCTPRSRSSSSTAGRSSPDGCRNGRGCRRRAASSGTSRVAEHDRHRLVVVERCRRAARAVSAGSSASTVPVPTTIASACARRRWTSARASGPVIHWLVPSAAAARPSRLWAHFTVTCGRPSRCTVSHEASSVGRLVREQARLDIDAGRRAGARAPPVDSGSGRAPRRSPGRRRRR